jgi:glycerol 3-phosphatase-2
LPADTASGTRLLDRYDAFAIDLDGVVWLAGAIIPWAPEAIAAIRKAGKGLLFLTNNASYLPSWIVAHLAEAGVDIDEGNVLTSASAARSWITREGLAGKRAFVLGAPPVVEQIADLLEVVPVERGVPVDVVLVARDLDLTYDRLAAASTAVRDGAVFLASNRDHVMPTEHGFDPGTGSVLAAIEAASGRRAVSLGKPELPMMEAAAERIGRSGVLMIGDRTDSDVAGARRIGWDAALVLTGVTKAGMPLDPAPDYVLPTLEALWSVGSGG